MSAMYHDQYASMTMNPNMGVVVDGSATDANAINSANNNNGPVGENYQDLTPEELMKVLSHDWESFLINEQPINTLNPLDSASQAAYDYVTQQPQQQPPVYQPTQNNPQYQQMHYLQQDPLITPPTITSHEDIQHTIFEGPTDFSQTVSTPVSTPISTPLPPSNQLSPSPCLLASNSPQYRQPFKNIPPGLLFSRQTVDQLETVFSNFETCKESIARMGQVQRHALLTNNQEEVQWLARSQCELEKTLREIMEAITNIHSSQFLAPPELQKITVMQQELIINNTQLQLYINELRQALTAAGKPSCFASLVIIQQEFPSVVSKNRVLDDSPITVELLTGATDQLKAISDIKVTPILETTPQKVPTHRMISVESGTTDETRRLFTFTLKMTAGTRKTPAFLKFTGKADYVGGSVGLESQLSKPFVVITNECQYEESDGTLLKKVAFGQSMEIPWPLFANHLQLHFARSTRQDFSSPERCLSPLDLNYLHTKFFGGKMISQAQFDTFWNWFGKVLQRVRYQRHISQMWKEGLIYGFLTREETDDILRTREPGTFVIRFSESHPGMFAVGYKVSSKPDDTGHYLVRPDDIGTKKSLPDFIGDESQWTRILQVRCDQEGRPQLRSYPKAVVLEVFYSKKEAVNAFDYDPVVRKSTEPPTTYASRMLHMLPLTGLGHTAPPCAVGDTTILTGPPLHQLPSTGTSTSDLQHQHNMSLTPSYPPSTPTTTTVATSILPPPLMQPLGRTTPITTNNNNSNPMGSNITPMTPGNPPTPGTASNTSSSPMPPSSSSTSSVTLLPPTHHLTIAPPLRQPPNSIPSSYSLAAPLFRIT
ncbi:transcriptional repressor [Pelomyxa schiedti]|nr:transcriptional repressor [Pelomyxa schiedti]